MEAGLVSTLSVLGIRKCKPLASWIGKDESSVGIPEG